MSSQTKVRVTRSQTLKRKAITINPYKKVENSTITGFLIDFDTFSIWEDGQERPGLNLYYFTDAREPVLCFLPHDPYFYVDCEERYKQSEREFNKLQIRIREVAKKQIQKIELVTVHDSLHPDHKFLAESQLVKITLDSPRSVKSREISVRDDVLRVNGVIGKWREADINFDMRVSIDNGKLVKVGRHYEVVVKSGIVNEIKEIPVDRFPDLPCCVYDLETCKDPMKTPNPDHNPIATIGVQFDYDDGFIICNKDKINDIPGKFVMGTTEVEGRKMLHWEDVSIDEAKFRETHDKCMLIEPIIMEDEHLTIIKFLDLILTFGSLAIAGYNSDNFDWPYVEKRLSVYNDSLQRFGFKHNKFLGAYYIPGILCLDAFLYVLQHSRLPEGERGLKKATKKIFHFDPIDWNDVEMLGRAMDPESEDYDPITVVYYNGSDIYCTMLFLKEIMIPYFMSLAMDKPMNLFQLTRRGFSVLCEGGLLQRAFNSNIVSPNRGTERLEKGSQVDINGRLYYLLSESYKGAKVELNKPGLYRSDLETQLKIDPDKLREMKEIIPEAIDFELKWITEKGGRISNKAEIIEESQKAIQLIIDNAELVNGEWFYNGPLEIIHCDVASLYPSIIINYKIQPQAIVTEEECEKCPYREMEPDCWCTLNWTRLFTIIDSNKENVEKATDLFKKRKIYDDRREITNELKMYKITDEDKTFTDVLEKVVKKDKKGKVKKEIEIPLSARMCQKAHGFFWREVQDIREDRYNYKYRAGDFFELKDKEEAKLKKYMKIVAAKYKRKGLNVFGDSGVLNEEILLKHMGDEDFDKRNEIIEKINEYQELATFNNFIQEGKKAGLNSYYGYLFTTGVRWWSIIGAGTITIKGREVLLGAIDYTSCVMHLLEADTDGYYTLIPKQFPIDVKFEMYGADGRRIGEKKSKVSLLSALLNLYCLKNFTNENSYDKIEDKWINTPRCYLKWDTDGPYDTMFVQAKKKYAIWKGGKLVILKGLETKRNNALMLERIIINNIFEKYTDTNTKSLNKAYKDAEQYFRTVVMELKQGKTPMEYLVKNTNINENSAKRLNNAIKAIEIMEINGIKDFAFSFKEMILIRLAADLLSGKLSSYKVKVILNSLGRKINESYFKMKSNDLHTVIEAYEGKSSGINKGAQFMTAFREWDMGVTIDEYSTVSFVKSIYPNGKTYTMNKKGKLTTKEIKGGTSEGMIPYSLLNMEMDIVNKFIERWTGNNPQIKSEEEKRKIIDFKYYISYIKNLCDRLIIVPASVQGITLSMEDLFDDSKIRNRSMDEFTEQETSMQKRTLPTFEKRKPKKKLVKDSGLSAFMSEDDESEEIPDLKATPLLQKKKTKKKRTLNMKDFLS